MMNKASQSKKLLIFLALTLVTCFFIIYVYKDINIKGTWQQITQLNYAMVHQLQNVFNSTSHSALHKTSETSNIIDRRTKQTTNASPYIDPVSYMNTSSNISSDDVKLIILQWNSPFWLTDWSKPIDMGLCKCKNCILSFDRGLFNQSSAVIFNLAHRPIGDKPPTDPDHRNPNQIWAFFVLESPLHMSTHEVRNPHWQNVFNWSWTYHPQADIFQPYGVMTTRKNVTTKNYSEIFRNKTKFAVWLVSHCHTPSRRENYVKTLQKYVSVDIYGGCGLKEPEDLENHLNMNYKFYLSFENSLCAHYVTEKFFNKYKLDIVPIVRGNNNYTGYFPNGTFIDTASFSSVTAMAKYLKYLADNEEEYVQYLKLKDNYEVHEHEFTYQNALCHVCTKLNFPDKHTKTISSAVQWLGSCDRNIQDLKEDSSVFSTTPAANTSVSKK